MQGDCRRLISLHWRGRGKRAYIGAIHSSLDRNYEPRAAARVIVHLAAPRRFQRAVKATAPAGAADALPLKGARIPSTADEDCAEIRSAALRAAADLR